MARIEGCKSYRVVVPVPLVKTPLVYKAYQKKSARRPLVNHPAWRSTSIENHGSLVALKQLVSVLPGRL